MPTHYVAILFIYNKGQISICQREKQEKAQEKEEKSKPPAGRVSTL